MSTSRRSILKLMAAGGAAPALSSANRKPNVLFVSVDDLNTDLGCYGHSLVRSPHIDRLARRGVRFERAYAQYPVCNPSRTSFLSGRYPEQAGVLDNRTDPRVNLGDVQFLPEYFRRHGYFTAQIGKIFHRGRPSPRDFAVSLNPRGTPLARRGEGRNLTDGRHGFFHWIAAEGADEDHSDGQVAAETIRLLEEKRDEPFFLGVGLHKPHDPYVAPKRYFEPYPLERIPPVGGPADDAADVPEAAYPPTNHGLGPREAIEYRRAYYACVTFMDAQLGKMLDALERLGLAGNTMVVFFSDHGIHLGEHGWWNKVTLFERSARVPLIIAGPGAAGGGRICRRTVELLDLYPTLAEAAGLPMPDGLEGKSLLPLLSDPAAEWDKPAYTVVRRGEKLGRTVRTERFRYTEWDEGRLGGELYDHNVDPNEYRNLSREAGYT
ncbi:MAG: sulfatase, partial [bacterium]|nr:sulfatase [bacterium]